MYESLHMMQGRFWYKWQLISSICQGGSPLPITKAQSSRLRYKHVVIAKLHLSSCMQLIPLCVYLHFPSIVHERNQSTMYGTLGRSIGKIIKMDVCLLVRDQKRWLRMWVWLVKGQSLIMWGSGWSKVWITYSALLSARAGEGVHCNDCCGWIRSCIHQK